MQLAITMGKMIVIKGDKESQMEAFKFLQQLTNNQLFLLKNGTVTSEQKGNEKNIIATGTVTKSSERRFNASKIVRGDKAYGTKLVSDVIKSKHTVTINSNKKSSNA